MNKFKYLYKKIDKKQTDICTEVHPPIRPLNFCLVLNILDIEDYIY